jgi:hypothetical protein
MAIPECSVCIYVKRPNGTPVLDTENHKIPHRRWSFHMLRKFLAKGLATVAAVALATHAGLAGAAPADGAPLKIGIIGSGHIGGTLAKLWVAAGHEVLMSSRPPEELRPLAQ